MGDDASPHDVEAAAPTASSEAYRSPRLHDRWDSSPPIMLGGLLERQQFPPLLMALLALVLALILFQVVVTPVAIVALLAAQGINFAEAFSDLPTLMERHAQTLITANTLGQVFALAVPTYVITRLHTNRPWGFLRLRAPDGVLLVLGLLGLLTLMPVVQWLGVVNEWLPLPETIRAFDQQQMDLVERVLEGDLGVGFSILALAITPAVCEEVLFRGYVQRQAERGVGAAWGIVVSGIIFGLYHLRLTQALPLIALGLYLAYLAWRTGSLWIPIVVHFANNAFAVALGLWANAQPDMGLQDIEHIAVPWYLVLGGALLSTGILYALHHRARAVLAERSPSVPPSSIL